MRFNKLDLNLLVALDVLLKERSVTRAAETLSLTPSTLSASLARLRQYFDDDLLVPIGRKMVVTPRAEKLQQAVRDVLMRIDMTIAVPPAFEPQRSDRMFRIMASDYTQIVLGPVLLSLAARQRSTVRIEFAPLLNRPYRYLERGETDVLIVPDGYVSSEHPHQVIYPEHYACMVWQGGELAQGDLTLERYAAAEHVVMQPESGRLDVLDGVILKRHGVARRVAVLTYSFVALPALLVGTDRIATVQARLGRRLAAAWPLALRPTPLPFEPAQQAIQWHKFRQDDPGLVWLRELLIEAGRRIDEA